MDHALILLNNLTPDIFHFIQKQKQGIFIGLLKEFRPFSDTFDLLRYQLNFLDVLSYTHCSRE